MLRPRGQSSSSSATSPTTERPARSLSRRNSDMGEDDTPQSHYPSGRSHAPPSYHASSGGAAGGGQDEYFPSSGLDEKRGGSSGGYGSGYDENEKGDRGKPVTGLGIGFMGSGKGGLGARRGGPAKSLKMDLSGLGIGPQSSKGKGRTGPRLALTPRGIVIIGVIAFLYLMSKALTPSPEPTLHVHNHPADAHQFVARDYLNNSRIDPAPFDFCPVFGPGDPIAARRGQFELLRSRLHTGTGARLQRVLHKAMSGAPVTISVLGGSVSSCVGAGEDPISERCYPSKFFNWWQSVFPHPANELTNGAVRKTDSAYYAYCSAHHMPDKADLVILEFDSADPNDRDWITHFELLVRSVMVRPEMPAVIVLGHFSPQVQAVHGFAGPELLHNVVAQYYDIPHISVKGVLYDSYMTSPEAARSAFYHDITHPNPDGHDLIADVLISYIMSQICMGWATLQGHSYDVPNLGSGSESEGNAGGPSLLGGVGLRKGMLGAVGDPGDGDSAGSSLADRYAGLRAPIGRLHDRPADLEKFREIEPFCVSASDLINPLPNSLFFGSGWHTYHPPPHAVNEDRHYWYAEQPTARLRIPVKIGAGDVGIYYLQSPPERPLGSVKCWVDDNYAGAKELQGTAEVEDTIATLFMIDRNVARGSHFVECQLQGDAGGVSPPFKILGIFTT